MSEKVATLTNPSVRIINEDNDAFFAFIDLAERVIKDMFPGIPVIDGYQRDPVELFRKYGG